MVIFLTRSALVGYASGSRELHGASRAHTINNLRSRNGCGNRRFWTTYDDSYESQSALASRLRNQRIC